MSSRNERFNASCLSLDGLAKSIDPAKLRVFSDRGEGAERICRAIDREDELDAERDLELDNRRFVLLMVAEGMLVLCEADRLVPVLEQIVANGANRQESICNLAMTWRQKKPIARVKYHRGVAALLKLFSPSKNAAKLHF